MLKDILGSLNNGSLDMITPANSSKISEMASNFISKPDKDIIKADLEEMLDILKISNILYNNTNRALLPLEDGVYDLLVVKYDTITKGKAPVGARPIHFNEQLQDSIATTDHELTEVVRRVARKDNMLFFDAITKNSTPIASDFYIGKDESLISKHVSNTAHNYPELVGTLDKCKFTLISEALRAGIDLEKDKVWIFERDFLHYHQTMGISANELILELKYDGVSVEAVIDGDEIIYAGSRGDTQFDEATDLTPLFGGYKFDRATNHVAKGTVFGIKFEAIITYSNLMKIKELYGKSYVNARTAIIGITSGLDARKFKDFITLVPLATAGLNFVEREVEIKFLNKFYTNGIDLRYQIINGDNTTLLYQVSKFVDEAEYMRSFIDFMYDGVVVSYTNPSIKQLLGRVNSINKWSIAIKFNALKKQTIFKGYRFTVGQDGRITPMAYFNEVEFLGTIHNHTTVHSLRRFMLLNLRVGDLVDTEYRHDVIVYLSKPNNSYNAKNSNPVIDFPIVCPSCGGEITVSDTGDSAYCLNINCPDKVVGRVTNMLKKLNIKDFGEAIIKKLQLQGMLDFMNIDRGIVERTIGKKMMEKFLDRREQVRSTQYPDYRMVGALGFTSLSSEKWKLILRNVELESIINKKDEELYPCIVTIKGIGKEGAMTVIKERAYFAQDLKMISKMENVQRTFGNTLEKVQVRFTGCRDENLSKALNGLGFDADGNKSVTKKTRYLIIPRDGYMSDKMKRISKTCSIITLDKAWVYAKSMKNQNID